MQQAGSPFDPEFLEQFRPPTNTGTTNTACNRPQPSLSVRSNFLMHTVGLEVRFLMSTDRQTDRNSRITKLQSSQKPNNNDDNSSRRLADAISPQIPINRSRNLRRMSTKVRQQRFWTNPVQKVQQQLVLLLVTDLGKIVRRSSNR